MKISLKWRQFRLSVTACGATSKVNDAKRITLGFQCFDAFMNTSALESTILMINTINSLMVNKGPLKGVNKDIHLTFLGSAWESFSTTGPFG